MRYHPVAMTTWRKALLVLSIALTLVAARAVVRAARSVGDSPAAGASWIWAEPGAVHGSPQAFFAVNDFELGFKPASAELVLVADEEYGLDLNGRHFARGCFRDDEVLDSYRVEALLRQGRNRLVVELRSARGAGGLLLRLVVAGEHGQQLTLVSDDSWQVFRRRSPTLLAGSLPEGGERPRVWGGQRSGRWSVPSSTRVAPTLRDLQGGQRRPPRPALRFGRHRGPWLRPAGGASEPLGAWARFDFGPSHTGFLQLEFGDTEGGSAFVYYGLRRAKQGLGRPDEVVLRAPGSAQWIASRPAEFRFVTVVGAPSLLGARVVRLPGLESPLAALPVSSGLLGIERRKTLVSPVENEVRSKLESIPGLARRKES